MPVVLGEKYAISNGRKHPMSTVKIKRIIHGNYEFDAYSIEYNIIECMRELLHDKNKCLLNIKSDDGFIRTLSRLLLKNDIDKVNRIDIYMVDSKIFARVFVDGIHESQLRKME